MMKWKRESIQRVTTYTTIQYHKYTYNIHGKENRKKNYVWCTYDCESHTHIYIHQNIKKNLDQINELIKKPNKSGLMLNSDKLPSRVLTFKGVCNSNTLQALFIPAMSGS